MLPLSLIFLQQRTWGTVFGEMAMSPQRFLPWIIVVLVLLFFLSRLNNNLEVRGVNRAIVIARGLVGSFMWFVIAPIIVFVFINVFALFYKAPTLDISFLGKWIALTFSSYWWLLRCAFGSQDLVGQAEAYTVHSIIRIIWIIVPITFIWLRTAKTRVSRLVLIPFILGILVVTRHKKCEETFITKEFGIQNLQNIPVIGVLFQDEHSAKQPGQKKGGMTVLQRKVVAGGLLAIVAVGFFVGLYWHKRLVGLVVVLIGILGFFFIAPTSNIHVKKKQLEHDPDHPIHTNIDSLTRCLDSLHTIVAESSNKQAVAHVQIEMYNISLALNEAYHYHVDQEGMHFPDTLCKGYYIDYFGDWCH